MATIITAAGTEADIFIRRGRKVTLAITVSGIDDWTGIEASFFYSREQEKESPSEIECTITEVENKVRLVLLPVVTKDLTDYYHYDLLLYKTAWQKDLIHGKLNVGKVTKIIVS